MDANLLSSRAIKHSSGQLFYFVHSLVERFEPSYIRGIDNQSPIAQEEISMSVAFPTHVWKMPNICKHIIVWLFSHMCAFSHTYVSKSKHVWKIAPRCKYTNVFGFFQTCWVKVKHLPKCNFTHRFGFFLTYLQKQTCKEKTNMFSLNTTILFFLWEMKIL